MFNKDFYPTPREIVETIVPVDINGKVVLEPSAGKGNIVDYCRDLGADVLACELNQDLATIVKSKASFIKPDFLQVTSEEISHIDFIIMNPPFSADEKHILHAWEIAPSGCHIISLCNWSTLQNDYTRHRHQLMTLIKDFGTSENLGDVFINAERTTEVEIGLINLYKPNTDSDFSGYFDDSDSEEEYQENGIMSYNAIRDVVNSYVAACKHYEQVLEMAVKMNSLVGKFGIGEITFVCEEGDAKTNKIRFQKELQKKCWHWIFKKMDMGKYVTKKLKEDLNKFVEKQCNVPFTMTNIYKMFDLVVGTHGSRMDAALMEVFDQLTRHYNENRYSVEGWKTNSHYLINQKFIMPYAVGQCWSKNGYVHCEWGSRQGEILDDLCKALCYLTGRQYNTNMQLHEFYNKNKICFGQWADWEFFEVKGFKKGTLHCKFKDENVWATFNRRVAEIKGFPLPEKL